MKGKGRLLTGVAAVQDGQDRLYRGASERATRRNDEIHPCFQDGEVGLHPSAFILHPFVQWGRSPKTAEIPREMPGVRSERIASMGPQSEDCGNPSSLHR